MKRATNRGGKPKYSSLPVLGPATDKRIAQRIQRLAEGAGRIIITGHERPDGDCIGSEVALCAVLKHAGFNAEIVNTDPTPPKYKFLTANTPIRVFVDGERLEADLIFVLDATHLGRLGRMTKAVSEFAPARVINMDHHLENPHFGVVNWVDTSASATGEMVWRLVSCCGWRVPPIALQALYAALVTDTGQFSYSNTNGRALRMAAEMIERGVDPEAIWRQVYLNKTPGELTLESRARASLACASGGRICAIALRHSDFVETGTGPQNTEEFASIPRALAGVEISVFFYEINGGARTKVSLRSTRALNCSRLASRFGGGGHKQAAGFIVDAPLDEARSRVMAEAEKFLERKIPNSKIQIPIKRKT